VLHFRHGHLHPKGRPENSSVLFKQAKPVPNKRSVPEFLYSFEFAKYLLQAPLPVAKSPFKVRAERDTPMEAFEAILWQLLGVYKGSMYFVE
jgi:hypothetical protein